MERSDWKKRSGPGLPWALIGLLVVLDASALAESSELTDPQGRPVRISATAFQPRSAGGSTPFTRYDGSVFGLSQENSFSPRDFYPPFMNGRGLASGDVDRDGWPDVVSATDDGVILYMNQKGESFTARTIDVPWLRGRSVFNAALVDLDDDGWLDLFATTHLDGNVYVLNRAGNFTEKGLRHPPRGTAVLSSAVSFGDIDRDGDLDVVVGNWTAGMQLQKPPPHSRNEVWIYEDGAYRVTPLAGIIGETLSTLLSDWSGDGWLDLIVGNDFDVPDFYYRGDTKGGFELLERQDGIIPQSGRSTMSLDTGDFDNDLDFDIFVDQITSRATGPSARATVTPLDKYCTEIQERSLRSRCLANVNARHIFNYDSSHRPSDVKKCGGLPRKEDQAGCMGIQVMITAIRHKNAQMCERIPADETRTRSICRMHFEAVIEQDQGMVQRSIPQLIGPNVLLVRDSEGRYTDRAEPLGVGFTGFSWNARFADVDNDEWQDLMVVSGSWLRASRSGTTSNFFLHNEAGKIFREATNEFGLQNNMIVSAYTVFDFDRDGDLDFVTNSVNGPLWLVRNNSDTGHSIAFQLRDGVGNAYGIGTKFTIHYGPGGARHQIRELKASGGYLSFDEPLAHFGLGAYERVERVEIDWSTGGSTMIPGPFEAGHIYSLERGRPGSPAPSSPPE